MAAINIHITIHDKLRIGFSQGASVFPWDFREASHPLRRIKTTLENSKKLGSNLVVAPCAIHIATLMYTLRMTLPK